jgi:CheY-like chemotaxis protein
MNPIHILLVEDDEVDVMDIGRSLEKAKIVHNITVARNGEEALWLLTKASKDDGQFPDIVLIDLNMPKMNGIELLENIRGNEDWKHLKCFIITTSDHKADRLAAKDLQVSGYIIKPLKLNSPSTMDAFNLMIDLLNFKSVG